ncbi:rhamnan synthesis F family protein [Aliiroseovarius sp. PTFE2010]|uniref:rhamnan synthesis F family protein n=1 Tax=Aliiroseovarius sp. PTFE2010 TaxID=3417190 RepID=UPI003CFAEF76
MTLAIYAIAEASDWGPHVPIALQELKRHADRLVMAGEIDKLAPQIAALPDGLQPDTIINAPGLAAAYRSGLPARLTGQAVILTGAHALGAMDIERLVQDCPPDGVLSAYPILDVQGPAQATNGPQTPLPSLDFAVLGADFAPRPSAAFLDGPADCQRPRAAEHSLRRYLQATRAPLRFALDAPGLAPLPGLFEPARVLKAGSPCVSSRIFNVDPGLADALAINVHAALEVLKNRAPALHCAGRELLRTENQPRAASVLAGDYAVLPTEDHRPSRSARVAVFLHVWYADSAGDLLDVVARIPGPVDLFVSTGSMASKVQIEDTLRSRNLTADVRLVEQNRGRDMSSLFITFADVALSERYDIALRLHSKRTPQMPVQVAQAFKEHLFANLVASPGYAARVIERFMDNPNLGLVMPPAVHTGFGTLGHGWFANRQPFSKWAARLDISLPKDDLTPLAPFGTMFWFRPKALQKLFAHPWRWTDYNAEPFHVDGGLAHVQERLIAYAVLDAGYDVLQVMSPEHAAMNYARLEWKYQALAGRLSSPSFVEQEREIRALSNKPRVVLRKWMVRTFGTLMRSSPRAGTMLRPVARRIFNLFAAR